MQLNCKNRINNNLALSDTTGNYFFINSSEGDSSAIEPASGYSKKIKVRSVRLDDYVIKNRIEKLNFESRSRGL